MNKYVTAALAFAAAGSVTYADPGDSDWLELDGEISSLASTLAPQGDGSGWTALLRSTYTFSSQNIADNNGTAFNGDDVSGFDFDDADLAFFGSVGDFGWRISGDLGEGDLDLEDAYAYWECGDYFTAKMGQFKPMVARSGYIDPEDQIFINRTVLGSALDFWDTGFGTSGTYDQFSWHTSILDGSNGVASDHFSALRVAYSYGLGVGKAEGALGGNDDLNGEIGAFVVNDDSNSNGSDQTSYGFDLAGNYGQFGFGGEVIVLDKDTTASTGPDFSPINSIGLSDDTTPYDLTVSYLINPDWEAALRWEDTDNSADQTLFSGSVNWYQNGNNAKWQAQITYVDADDGEEDGTVFQVGLVVGATR